jgi:hypothetical protein
MNLLNGFGLAGDIIASRHMRMFNPDDLPEGVGNMFTTDLEGAALLAGLMGCDTYTIDNGITWFSGDTERLEFVGMIGRYTHNDTKMPTDVHNHHI